MATYTYYLAVKYGDSWNKLWEGSRQYCQGFMDARADYSPRCAMRLMRSDGKIIEELAADEDVGIGMIAGWPTAEQYELAAAKALQRAHIIRENNRIQELQREERNKMSLS